MKELNSVDLLQEVGSPEGDLGVGGRERPRRPPRRKTGVWSSLSVEPVLLAKLGWRGKRPMSQDAARCRGEGCGPAPAPRALPPFPRLLAKRTLKSRKSPLEEDVRLFPCRLRSIFWPWPGLVGF